MQAEHNLCCTHVKFIECNNYKPGCVGNVDGLGFNPK